VPPGECCTEEPGIPRVRRYRFFVISGFLITGLIRHEMDCGTISIANFYERRIRRILPALFAVILRPATLAAIASWHFVERPFRGKSGILDRQQLFRTTIA
jgi:peptidoglycan/LPS O-acetylase OafA/YrhL